MVWSFERAHGEVVRLENFFDNDTQEYLLIVQATNVVVRTERFGTQQSYHARLAALEHHLRANGGYNTVTLKSLRRLAWTDSSTQLAISRGSSASGPNADSYFL